VGVTVRVDAMSENTLTRRRTLQVAGTAGATALGGALVTSVSAQSGGWTEVDSPVSKTLYGVVNTQAGPFAAGKTGNVLGRVDGSWRVVVDDGPQTRSNSLRTLAVTDDGKRIWFAGSSGALGAYDVVEGVKYNYSAPKEKTSTWEGITLTGARDEETIYVSNGSGEVLKGTTDADGCVNWGEVRKPGSGSNVPAIDFRESDRTIGHAVDTSSNAFETTDGGETWTDIGVPNSQVPIYDVISYVREDTQRVYAAGGGGKIYRLDCVCQLWTPTDVGSQALRCVTREGDDKLVCGDSGVAFEVTGAEGWERLDTPVSSAVYEGVYGDGDRPDVMVGSNGVILER
jgi:hypothetical protein